MKGRKPLFNPLKLLAVGVGLFGFIHITNIDYDFERNSRKNDEPLTKRTEEASIDERQSISYSNYKASKAPTEETEIESTQVEAVNIKEVIKNLNVTSWSNNMIMERENSEIAFGFFKPFDLESVHKRNDGHMYARNYLVVTLHKAYFSKQKAERIADAHNARLTGAYPKFDWVQLWYPTNSFEELETAAITLSKDERVKEVSYDRVRIRTPNPTNK